MRELVYQAQEKGCGFATVKMALIHMSKDRRYAFLPEPPVEEAPDLATLICYAAKAGLSLRGLEAPHPEEIREYAGFPILVVLREEGKTHMAFLRKRTGRRYLLLDPSKGKRTPLERDLLAVWTGQFLEIEGYEKKGEQPPFWSKPLLGVSPFLTPVLTLLPMIAVTLGFVFLDFSFPFYATLACLLSGLALSLTLKAYQLGAMDRFDARYMDGVDAKDLKRRRELFVHYHAYKRAAFVSGYDVLGRVVSLGAALVFLCFHDLYLAGAAGASCLFVAVGHALLDGRLSYLRQRTESLEGRYFMALVGERSRKEMRHSLCSYGKRYGMALGLWNAAVILSSVVLAIAFCLFQGILHPQILVFYLMAVLTVAFETEKAFLSQGLLEDRRKEEPFFILNIASRVNC